MKPNSGGAQSEKTNLKSRGGVKGGLQQPRQGENGGSGGERWSKSHLGGGVHWCGKGGYGG